MDTQDCGRARRHAPTRPSCLPRLAMRASKAASLSSTADRSLLHHSPTQGQGPPQGTPRTHKRLARMRPPPPTENAQRRWSSARACKRAKGQGSEALEAARPNHTRGHKDSAAAKKAAAAEHVRCVDAGVATAQLALAQADHGPLCVHHLAEQARQLACTHAHPCTQVPIRKRNPSEDPTGAHSATSPVEAHLPATARAHSACSNPLHTAAPPAP